MGAQYRDLPGLGVMEPAMDGWARSRIDLRLEYGYNVYAARTPRRLGDDILPSGDFILGMAAEPDALHSTGMDKNANLQEHRS